jgi:glycosyltransferase involved in cell wall biosynthesis
MYKDSTGPGPWCASAASASSARVIAVFSDLSDSSLRVIRHLQDGANGTPVWLFSTVAPVPELAALCDRVILRPNAAQLLIAAQQQLFPLRAALLVGDWTGDGSSLLKLCPFLVPPFRALFLNRTGDFLQGTPANVFRHCHHRLRESLHNDAVRSRELLSGAWRLVSYHIWRSGPVTRTKDCAGAAAVVSLATLLRWANYPHRHFFRRLHGNASLTPELAGESRSGTVCFYQPDHNWNAAALSSLAETTDARFLVWHNGSGPGGVDDLLPLFDDPATFAVSRQSNYRAWKPALLPTAPFRPLQPGERTQVLAPLGSAIVVDLNKLTALGLPAVGHTTTAWMLLFWKAAAAGWKCYSAGQEHPLSPEADFPADETAFLLRLALEPGLRALGPRDPLLARGNVAFSSDPRLAPRIAGARPRVLIVSPFLPYPLSHGGAVRIYNLCRALAERVDFALIAVRENREVVEYSRLHEVFREVRIVDIDQTAALPGDLPEQVRQHECPALRAAIADLCREWQPDLVQFEYTQTAALKDAAQGIPAILVEHDITYSLYRQLADVERTAKSRGEYRRWFDFENRALAEFEAVWTVSDTDRDLAVESAPRPAARTFTIANGVDTARFLPTPEPDGPPEVLYVGSFRHLPNILAFEHLRSEIMPTVWQRFPDAILRVVAGPRHRYFWERFDAKSQQRPLDTRIHLHDFVEDLRPLYAAATVVAIPLQVSAGTSIKVMEAMACGRAIVSTQTGCAGLDLADGKDLLIRDDSADFAGALCDLLSDRTRRQMLGAQARQTVEARFSWAAIAEAAWQSYQSLMPTLQ